MTRATAILAGPGTGKTTTLVAKLRELVVDDGVDAGSIACVTFSRSAATNIRERAMMAADGDMRLGAIWYGTTHALALRIVAEGSWTLGLPSRVTLYDEDDVKDLCALVSEMRLFGKISKTKIFKATRAPAGDPKFSNMEHRAADHVKIIMRRAGVITYDDALFLATRVLQKAPDILRRWTYRCRTLLVDEAHDTSASEARLYEALQPERLIAVGDVNQSIYGFRGGDSSWLLELAETAEIEHLNKSWRCGQAICEVANSLIEHNPENQSLDLEAAQEKDSAVEASHGSPDEPGEVVDRLRALDGSRAVIVRTNYAAETWAEALRAEGLTVNLVTSPRSIWKEESARKLWLSLRASANPNDPVAEGTVCKLWGFPQVAIDKSKHAAVKGDESTLECLGWPHASDANLLELCSAVADRVKDSDAFQRSVEAVHAWCQRTGLYDPVELITDVSSLLVPEPEECEDAITVITSHMSKGLEWDHVVVPDLKKGHTGYPAPYSKIEEERRVLYVALTRARTSLTLVRPEDREPSVFWAEMTGEVAEPVS